MRPAVEPPARCLEGNQRIEPFRVSGDVCVFPPLLEERMPKMRKTLVSLCAATALLFTGTAVRADNIPWGYSATDTTIFNSNNPIQTSSIAFKGSSSVATGNSGIIIYNLTTASSQDPATPDSFANVPFGLGVTLTDIKATSSALPTAVTTGWVRFAGLFNATNVSKSSLLPGTNTWTSPVTAPPLILGSDDTGWRSYSVQVVSFTPPGQPGGAPGSIEAVVTVTPTDAHGGGGGTQPPTAPEPTSLVLAGLALPALLMARRRLKKAQQA